MSNAQNTRPYCWRAVGGTIWNHKTSDDDTSLYDQAALDAAVAAERKRCVKVLVSRMSAVSAESARFLLRE